MKDSIKNWFKNCLATTALTLLLITFVGTITKDSTIYISVIWQSTLANIIIHLGLIFIRKINSLYYFAEIMAEFGYVLGVILATGYICGWFITTTPLITVAITVIVFFVAILINAIAINKDVKEINTIIKLKREQST